MADVAFPPENAGTRPPVVGIREVVACRLTGSAAPREARALLLGSRIDTRGLEDFVEPDRLSAEGAGAIFVFRYGAVALCGASVEQEHDLLDRLAPHVLEPVEPIEIEAAALQFRADADEQVDAAGQILLREPSAERLQLIATVLARSVVLARDEIRIAQAFDRVEPLVNALRTRGRAGLPIRRVMRHIGDVLAARHRMVGRAQVGEKPDLLWDHPELDRLYARLEAEYELGDRGRAIERKLDVIGDATGVLLDLVQDRRSVRLELAIIGLIAFEIILSLYEMGLFR